MRRMTMMTRNLIRGGAAALGALALAACGGAAGDDAPSIAALYAPPDAGMIAWVDAQQAAAYASDALDALPEGVGETLSLDEILSELSEESGFQLSGIAEVMAFANADLDGGAVVIGGGFADDFLQSVRELAEGVEFEETTYRGAAMIESDGFFGIGAFAAAVVWDGGDDGDGPERNIIGTSDEVRAALDRRADGAADGETSGPAMAALREIGGGWARFAMAVPDEALDDLAAMLPDEAPDGLPDEYGALFEGIDSAVLSGLTLVGFAANRDAEGGERWTLRLEYGEAGDAERAQSLAEGVISVSSALAAEGASREILEAMEVSLDGTVVTVVSEATAEQVAAIRAEQAAEIGERMEEDMGMEGRGMAL